jgi:hypothetical protein
MSDTKPEIDDEELIPVETMPEDDKEPEDDQSVDDEDDGEDERLATSEDDSDAEISERTKTNREQRKKRREVLRKAKEADRLRIEMLQRQNQEMLQRLAAIEGTAHQSAVQTLEQKIAATRAEIQQAEYVIAKATEAGNGDDVVAAMRMRDQAMASAQQLEYAKQQATQTRAPQVNPQVVNYAKEWMQANPWYDPQARDRDSALTKGIDAELAREGYDPASRDYWEELTARVADAFGDGDSSPAQKTSERPRRKAPPTGQTREHAPQSTKREIYVTPERKAAMIDAGIWDDPARRTQMLKAYQAYDKSSAS